MTPSERWLAATWPVVRAALPDAPARVLELGCGPLGGFVPMLLREGYDAVGIDPVAPDEPQYRRVEFEHADLPPEVDAVVASTSLHHVADPAHVLDRVVAVLSESGVTVVVEWAWEDFDRQTADWCFERLGTEGEPGWLHRRRDAWLASGEEWTPHLRGWATSEGLHRADALVRLLDERLERRRLAYGPYYFAALADTTDEDERVAIDAGLVSANRIEYVGARRRPA